MDIKHILKGHAYQNIPLNFEEAYELGVYALRGCNGDGMAQKQSIAALCALHNQATYRWKKGEISDRYHDGELPIDAAEQIAGICAAIFENDIAGSEFGFVDPDVPFAIDNCGMGGDIITTANVSTIAAFIAAAAGIPMCKHGSPANADKGKYGSSDFISLICGIDNYAHRKTVERCVEEYRFGYTEACDTRYKAIHLQTHKIAMLPHMNDIIGPITNPLNPKKHSRRVLGINHLIPPAVVAQAYLILNQKGITNLEHGLFVRGYVDEYHHSGVDEVSICSGGTAVVELLDGDIVEYHLQASDFGIESVSVESIAPIGNKGEFSLKILKGEVAGPPLQMILANAAIIFYLAKKADLMRDCYQLAKETFLSGKAYEVMLNVQKETSEHKI